MKITNTSFPLVFYLSCYSNESLDSSASAIVSSKLLSQLKVLYSPNKVGGLIKGCNDDGEKPVTEKCKFAYSCILWLHSNSKKDMCNKKR